MAVRKMSLTELSNRVGLTLANLSNLKRGKARAIRFSTLESLCVALKCQPADLLEYSPKELLWQEQEINLVAMIKKRETVVPGNTK